ncbi:MAG: hypothetical protein AAF401_12950 [Pseudomonadota bacterium]
MPVFLLAIGVTSVAFLATLWNANQFAVVTGRKRDMHAAVLVAMIGVLAMLGLGAPEWAVRLFAVALIASTLWLGLTERGRAAFYCLVQCSFGGVVALGLPFQMI